MLLLKHYKPNPTEKKHRESDISLDGYKLCGVLFEFHDVECYGHPGVDRTLRLVEQHSIGGTRYGVYVLMSSRAKFVSERRLETPNHRVYCKASQFRVDGGHTWRWISLLLYQNCRSNCDSVLVVIDQLTKRAHFVVCKGTATARDVAELYRDRIFALHGIPTEILSDRDPKFTATVWTTLCTMLGTRQKLTTAFRHQANRVTERLNQIIENYLRVFTNGASEDWDTYLALAEFVYNSRLQQAISMSPFEADIGYLPSTPATLLSPPRATGAE
ncbi:unnamed protein product [Phytophthora fragariaefolia]|uniref:Unnamed protein product n=1 Tax=Phytophthora fragariaefolia TaxID=1490495 RepID=A0A9W6YET5_9STRA|nr:unnamed protein product [Phytophthora fragariaefolia]